MEIAQLIAFNGVLLAALISPGPAMLIALRTTLADGRRAGTLLGLGLALAAGFWTLLALLGLGAVFAVLPVAYSALKTLGAAYLIWIAFNIWRDARQPMGDAPATPRRRHFLRGLLVNLGNPKSMLFAASVIVVIFPRDLGPADITLIVANHVAVEIIAYAGFALLMSTRAARSGYLTAKPWLDRAAATVLAALGLRLMLDRG